MSETAAIVVAELALSVAAVCSSTAANAARFPGSLTGSLLGGLLRCNRKTATQLLRPTGMAMDPATSSAPTPSAATSSAATPEAIAPATSPATASAATNLATTLEDRPVENSIREVGINPNCWYAVARSRDLPTAGTLPVTVWYRDIALYRDESGVVRALEDACPHKGVALHKGDVRGDRLACPYHGWEFDGSGACAKVPYLPPSQKLPRACARSFPVRERYDLIWLFPGDPSLADTATLPEMPETEGEGWLRVPVTAKFAAHFSMCNENTMDVFHGYLHRELQGWFDPELIELRETEDSVCARYNVSYRGRLAKWLGLSDRADTVTRLPIAIDYRYPNFSTHLEGVSSLYLMRLPVSKTESRSFAYFFFRVPLPKRVLALLRPVLRPLLERFVLMRFLRQDIEMVESEQRAYLANLQRRYVEINPAIFALQRAIVRQARRGQQEK